jgi:hypothetical protein
MSAVGQSRRFRNASKESGFPLTADIRAQRLKDHASPVPRFRQCSNTVNHPLADHNAIQAFQYFFFFAFNTQRRSPVAATQGRRDPARPAIQDRDREVLCTP